MAGEPKRRGPKPKTGKLSAVNLKKLGPGYHGDGGGLYLQVAESGRGRSWIFRYTFRGKEHEIGLGSLDAVGLGDAREEATACRRLLTGTLTSPPVDPRSYRAAQWAAAAAEEAKATAERAKVRTFKQWAEDHIASRRDGWGNAKHAGQWAATLATYAYPVIGDLPITEVDTDLVMKVLRPIWTVKNETAKRVRGRIEEVIDAAKALNRYQGENPARWRGHLDKLLPSPSTIAPVEHWPALPYGRMAEFMAELRQKEDSVGRDATEFTILTNLRTGSVRKAHKTEIDLANAVWTIPPLHLKHKKGKAPKKPLRVPLSAPALAIAEKMIAAFPDSKYLFPGEKPGEPMSNQTMLMLVKRMGYRETDEPEARMVVTHGFRSTFKDWAHEVCTPRLPDDVIEAAMAHAIDDAVEAAYRRGDLFRQRRQLMDLWAQFCETAYDATGDNVLQFPAAATV